MMQGKNIVLTGASSGIGFEALKLLIQGEGNRILAVARRIDMLEGLSDKVIPFSCDVSSKEGIESIFEKAESIFDKIDIFYANAGFPYYEKFDYTDWQRIEKIFDTNTLSPMYTYSRYLKHLNSRDGHLGYTISAMGQMAMPGYALYTATKFALEGFQEAVRIEMPKNLKLTCLYPVATATNFFNVASSKEKVDVPFPVQTPEVVAAAMLIGLEKGKKHVYPCSLFSFAKVLMAHIPPVKMVYLGMEKAKFDRHIKKIKEKANGI